MPLLLNYWLVHEGIIRPVVSVLTLTWNIHYWNVQFLNNVIIIKTKVLKFTSCLPMVGGSLRVLRLLPPLKLVAMIYSWNIAQSGIKHQKSINQSKPPPPPQGIDDLSRFWLTYVLLLPNNFKSLVDVPDSSILTVFQIIPKNNRRLW
jgi:hypothetical protein